MKRVVLMRKASSKVLCMWVELAAVATECNVMAIFTCLVSAHVNAIELANTLEFPIIMIYGWYDGIIGSDWTDFKPRLESRKDRNGQQARANSYYVVRYPTSPYDK